MTKSIEEQARDHANKHVGPWKASAKRAVAFGYESGAKSRDAQLMTVVNGLETLYYNNPNVRQDAYNQGVRDCIARLTKADQMLKEMKL